MCLKLNARRIQLVLMDHLLARSSILSLLTRAIKIGYLEILDSGDVLRFGQYREGCKVVRANVLNDKFWIRVFTSADLGGISVLYAP